MSSALERLIYLVSLKNDINKRRRRFYTIGNPPKEWKDGKYVNKHKSKPIMSKKEADKRYKEAQAEMKTYTKEIRSLCKLVGAHLTWDGSGGVSTVTVDVEGTQLRIYRKQFQEYVDMYKFDEIMLKE